MAQANLCNLSTMGQVENGIIYIKDAGSNIYLIDDSCKVVVKAGSFASFIDNTSNKDVNITIEADASVKYTILDSKSSNRVFENSGELIVNQITLAETNEKLLVNLLRENASCDIKALILADGFRSDFNQVVNHKEKQTFSNISNVGIAMGQGKILFDTTGKIFSGMEKSKCAQLSRGIVMDDDSEVMAKPILLIDEFDCFANHGAAIGKMSDEDLFYLMSRGLTKEDAFLLILKGIIKPFIDNVPLDEWKDRVNEEIQNMIKK